jgi:hypothetical protein
MIQDSLNRLGDIKPKVEKLCDVAHNIMQSLDGIITDPNPLVAKYVLYAKDKNVYKLIKYLDGEFIGVRDFAGSSGIYVKFKDNSGMVVAKDSSYYIQDIDKYWSNPCPNY